MKDSNLYYTFGKNKSVAVTKLGNGCEGADMNAVLTYVKANEFSTHKCWSNFF